MAQSYESGTFYVKQLQHLRCNLNFVYPSQPLEELRPPPITADRLLIVLAGKSRLCRFWPTKRHGPVHPQRVVS